MTTLQQLIERQQGEFRKEIDKQWLYAPGHISIKTVAIEEHKKSVTQTATLAYLAGLKAALAGLPEKEQNHELSEYADIHAQRIYVKNEGYNQCRQTIKDHIEKLLAEVEGNQQ
jgi:hypothetical protein